MGDPVKQRKQYHTPRHPWQAARIEEENKILNDYGLKNKRDVWKMKSVLSNLTTQAKKLAGISGKQSEKEKSLLLKKLYSLGLIAQNAQLEDVLALTLNNILNRRLQAVVCKKALAKSMKQARQFITHGHILVGNNKIKAPSYIVHREEENQIFFSPKSSLISEGHAERVTVAKKQKRKESKNNARNKNQGMKWQKRRART